jgi:hypothetical protein
MAINHLQPPPPSPRQLHSYSTEPRIKEAAQIRIIGNIKSNDIIIRAHIAAEASRAKTATPRRHGLLPTNVGGANQCSPPPAHPSSSRYIGASAGPDSHGLRAARACPPAIHVRAPHRTSSSALINMHLHRGGPDLSQRPHPGAGRTSGSAGEGVRRNPHDMGWAIVHCSRHPVFCGIWPARPYSLWGLTSLTRPDAGRPIYSTLLANSPQRRAPDRRQRAGPSSILPATF